MKLRLEIRNDDTDEILIGHIMEYRDDKLRFMPSRKWLKEKLRRLYTNHIVMGDCGQLYDDRGGFIKSEEMNI